MSSLGSNLRLVKIIYIVDLDKMLLLYLIDEVRNPVLTSKAVGHK